MATDLDWALNRVKNRSQRLREYKLYSDYYDGDQRLAFATERFRTTFGHLFKEFAENFCAAVVDSLTDRLVVTGFRSSDATVTTENVNSQITGEQSHSKISVTDPLGERASRIWQLNDMELKSQEVYRESLKCGDSYVIVWPDDQMFPAIFPQESWQCEVQYDPNNPKTILRALKIWYDDLEDRLRMNVYTETQIVKYITRDKVEGYIPDSPGNWRVFGTVPNIYGTVPVFHFPNRTPHKLGISELRDAIAIQDGLNKSVMDMMIAMEFASYKQRYIIGLDVEIDPETGEPKDNFARNYGADRMMAIPDPDSKVGQFDATDLGQFLRVQDKFWASAARVTGTPLHYFFITSGDFPSGEAMKSAEARFVKKIEDRQILFGQKWEQVMKFALLIEGPPAGEDVEVEPVWEDATSRSDAEIADTAVKKKAVGVSRSQILKELGYDDDTISRMLEESDSYALAQAQLGASLQGNDRTNPNPNRTPGQNNNGQPTPTSSGTKGVTR